MKVNSNGTVESQRGQVTERVNDAQSLDSDLLTQAMDGSNADGIRIHMS